MAETFPPAYELTTRPCTIHESRYRWVITAQGKPIQTSTESFETSELAHMDGRITFEKLVKSSRIGQWRAIANATQCTEPVTMLLAGWLYWWLQAWASRWRWNITGSEVKNAPRIISYFNLTHYRIASAPSSSVAEAEKRLYKTRVEIWQRDRRVIQLRPK